VKTALSIARARDGQGEKSANDVTTIADLDWDYPSNVQCPAPSGQLVGPTGNTAREFGGPVFTANAYVRLR